VVELEEGALVTATPLHAQEGAATEVAQEDGPPDLGRYVSRFSPRPPRRPRALGQGKPLPSQVGEQSAEGAIQDGRVVAAGDGVAQHVLGQAQALEGLPSDRDLQTVAIG
jgi:hypothetical protein